MPGHDDDHPCGGQPLPLAEQPVQSGHADVVQPRDLVPHQLRGPGRLFRDRQVGRAGRGDDDGAPDRASRPADET